MLFTSQSMRLEEMQERDVWFVSGWALTKWFTHNVRLVTFFCALRNVGKSGILLNISKDKKNVGERENVMSKLFYNRMVMNTSVALRRYLPSDWPRHYWCFLFFLSFLFKVICYISIGFTSPSFLIRLFSSYRN